MKQETNSKYAYLNKEFIEEIRKFDLKMCYDNICERAKVNHPMLRKEGRIDADNLLRKEIDDKILWNYLQMKAHLYKWVSPRCGAEFISIEACKQLMQSANKGNITAGALNKLHCEHLIPFNVIAKDILEKCDKGGDLTFEDFKALCTKIHFALVTKEEAKLMDKQYKSTMPEDRKEIIMARMDVCGIKYTKVELSDEDRGKNGFYNYLLESNMNYVI